ncbi:MAG TPA: peptidase M16, partial [Solibacterales bacterium]|nr:peptidase M16 [Bryobacterales bacterium]
KPSNILITAAGNLRHAELVDLAASRFGRLKNTGAVPPYGSPKTSAGVTLKNKRSLHQVHLCLGTPSHPLAHQLRFACYILNVVLGGGMSSRLFQNVREKLGLAYAIFSELSLYRDTGCLAVYAGTSLENTPRVVDLVLREFADLKQRALTEDELRRAKEHLKGSMMLGLESTSSRMGNLARQALYFGRFFSLDEMADSIEQVTSDQVQSVAREFLQQERINLTVLGRIDGLALNHEDLRC